MQQPPSYLPLIFALKDLRIKYFPNQFDSPKEFSRSACLVRGDTVLEIPNDVTTDTFLKNETFEPLPPDPMAPLLLLELPLLPEDVLIAMRGIFAFGPRDIELAKKCAFHSLKLNNQCTLAKQLLQLLTENKDPRIPFGK